MLCCNDIDTGAQVANLAAAAGASSADSCCKDPAHTSTGVAVCVCVCGRGGLLQLFLNVDQLCSANWHHLLLILNRSTAYCCQLTCTPYLLRCEVASFTKQVGACLVLPFGHEADETCKA